MPRCISCIPTTAFFCCTLFAVLFFPLRLPIGPYVTTSKGLPDQYFCFVPFLPEDRQGNSPFSFFCLSPFSLPLGVREVHNPLFWSFPSCLIHFCLSPHPGPPKTMSSLFCCLFFLFPDGVPPWNTSFVFVNPASYHIRVKRIFSPLALFFPWKSLTPLPQFTLIFLVSRIRVQHPLYPGRLLVLFGYIRGRKTESLLLFSFHVFFRPSPFFPKAVLCSASVGIDANFAFFRFGSLRRRAQLIYSFFFFYH